MGHYASMCSFKEEDNPNQSKRQRSLAQRRCFGCHEKGHKIEACANRAKVPSGKPGGTGFTLETPYETQQGISEGSSKIQREEWLRDKCK
jgi:hypothetical protein